MIILTPRLNAIVNNINKGEKVADIGTDHGYLPLFLREKNISPKIVFTDVSKGSLSKAEENCKRLFPNEEFDLRLGDGLEVLEKGEVDTVVMAGIGGLLSIDILEWDITKTLSFNKFIFQPRNNGGALRRYLYEVGFEIEKMIIAPEDKRYCEIIVANTPKDFAGRKDSDSINNLEFELPDILVEKSEGYVKEYLENAIELEKRIIENVAKGREKSAKDLMDDVQIKNRMNKIERIEKLLARL